MGVDLAAAEWIIRNGGRVKFNQKNDKYQDSYDLLLTDSNLRQYHLTEIDATEASVTHHGFRYLSNLQLFSFVNIFVIKLILFFFEKVI